ncbi:hypothetical protein OEZ85_011103 [Tetradesmus obliquus]|uniref:Pectinesterase inhibitor domain-containing protein n=1 Tax=Tetradesmus obliquus TaxID=3088 RepID=A0ABY8TPY5_TETOB|nr:hypothetical protein OEZ85_011103 [Tetradesmus obliquus]
MKSYKVFAVLALLAFGTASTAAQRVLLQAGAAAGAAGATCPVDPSKTVLDFSKVSNDCAAQANVCTTCVCALVGAFAPALAAGGIKFDAAAPESFPLAQAAGVLRSCAEEYIVAMMMAGVNVSALAELNNCGFGSAADVPACLSAEVTGINSANATVTATSRTDSDNLSGVNIPESSAATSSLRIATVQATPSGPVFTLAGQLDSASQLLQAMAASQELTAAMSPEAAAQLSSMAAAERSLLQAAAMDDLSAVTTPQATAATSSLRIATVQATPSGPVFTLAGQLDSASQLLQAMAASQAA